MLHSLLALKMAAMVAALGLDTAEWNKPSPDVVAQVQALADLQVKASKGEAAPEGGGLQDVINKIKDLADKGDKDAQFSMGLFLQQSNGQGALQQALEYYKKAADQGQLQAMNNYGFIVAASTQDIAQAKQGIEYIKQASQKGLNAARRNMATIYLRGMAGEAQNIDEAKKLLETAAADKDYQAEFELAQFYLSTGGEKNQSDEQAWKLLNAAAEHGNPNALAALGSVLFDGKEFGVKKKPIPADPKKAVQLFTRLADQNNPAGLRTMGELYQKGIPGTGIEKDFTKALDYYGRAAQANDAVAQVILAGFYDRGFDFDGDKKLEVAPNPAASLELYRLAAQNNVPLAFYNVGAFYEAGRAVDKDMTKAFAYFLQSAVNGFGPGMQKAGVYYLNGAGTLKDPVAATGWFGRSAGAGVPEGLISLGVMAENGLVPSGDASKSAYETASTFYQAVEDNPASTDPVRLEGLLRLGSLYLRGLMVGPDKPANPDKARAYQYFKFASEIDPQNKLAKDATAQVEKDLTVEQKTNATSVIESLKKHREEVMSKAAKAQAAASPGAAPAGGTPAPAPAPQPPPPQPTGKKKGSK